MDKPLKIGTRGSPLALAQVELLVAALTAAHPALETQVVKIITSGDRIQDRALSEAGGKGLFTKEIEEALLAGGIDCAVHSMKDMPPLLPQGLEISCLLPREDVRDVFFSTRAATIDGLPQGASVGTSSLRRQALLLARRPDLKITLLRGNVGTRLRKLEEGAADATLLALAGLNRLGLAHLAVNVLPVEIMPPAAAQGAVGIETRIGDDRVQALLAAVHCRVTGLRVEAERAFLEAMDGSCRTPLAALMEAPDAENRARFRVWSATPDGGQVRFAEYNESVPDLAAARRLGLDAGRKLKAFT